MKLFYSMLALGFCLTLNSQAFAASKVMEVPYSKQYRAFSCGHNTFRMMMGYWGQRLTRQRIIDNVGIGGTNGDAYDDYVKKKWSGEFTFQFVNSSTEALKNELSKDHPVVVGVDASFLEYLDYDSNGGHAILLIGFDDAKKLFYLRDPNTPYIESIGYDRLQKALTSKNKSAYNVYRKDGKFVGKNAVQHFDKAKAFGAAKEKKSGIPVGWLIPDVHMTYGNNPHPSLGEGFEKTEFDQGYRYHVLWNGFHYGNMTLEQTPWLGNGKIFKQMGFNASYTMRGNRFRLGAGELMSPGTYTFGRHRTLDIHNFSATKQIPALSLSSPTIEVSGLQKRDNDEVLAYPELGFVAEKWGGVRVGLRYGLHPLLGHASLGYTSAKVRFTMDDSVAGPAVEATMPAQTFDVTLGPLKGSYQAASTENADSFKVSNAKFTDKLTVESHSVGFDAQIPGLGGNPVVSTLTYIGLFRSHFEYTNEILRKNIGPEGSGSSVHSAKQRWDAEFPIRAGFADFAWGWSVHADEVSGISSTYHSAWLKALYNNFLPFAQIQVGYRVLYDAEKAFGQELMSGLYIGL